MSKQLDSHISLYYYQKAYHDWIIEQFQKDNQEMLVIFDQDQTTERIGLSKHKAKQAAVKLSINLRRQRMNRNAITKHGLVTQEEINKSRFIEEHKDELRRDLKRRFRKQRHKIIRLIKGT